jgi:peptide/nickel transport system permease protein
MSPVQLGLAIEAFRRGEINSARKLVAQVLLADPATEQAWLLMARLVKNREQVIDCLEHASIINPTNLATISALQMMKRGKHTHVGSIPSSTLITPAHPRNMISGKPIAAVKKADSKPVSLSLPETTVETVRPARQKLNGSLIFGSLIVLFVVLLAIIGPPLAPQNPMELHPILQVGDRWVVPPFNAFHVPGYPLGSDQFGRDVLSRLLYAVRPTLIMVSLVALVRLFLGTLIGLGAGYFNGRGGRFLNGLISAALAVPILLVALGVITMVGAQTGLVAFVIGLSINGWGETARFVRVQTQLIKGQLFIESARSLGASTFQILTHHIFRQIMPMVWMLFAFEISGTLMVTAGLGFLGYYIGGDVWIDVADFVSSRTSGAPELGQMLANTRINMLQSWPLVFAGLVIFITIYGFSLLGEGLRSRLNPEFINRNNPLTLLGHRFSLWFEESISYPTLSWFKANRLRPILLSLVVVALAASLYLYKTGLANRFNPSRAALTVSGGQIWSSEKVDPYGTSYINFIGPARANRLWMINDPAGFSGSPVISADGTIYVAGLASKLIAVNPDGSQRWVVSTPEVPFGSPALAANNAIYVTNSKGGLSAFNSDGSLLWTYSTETYGKPNHGAIVAPDGHIYYLLEDPRGDTLIALTPGGQLLWSVHPGTRAVDTVLRLSPDGQEIYVKNKVVNSRDGSLVDLTLPTLGNSVLANQAHLLVGADGKTYLLAGHEVIQWTQTSQGFNIVQRANWNYRGFGFSQNSGFPVDAGVMATGDIWLFYSGLYGEGTSVYWLDSTGKILGRFSSSFSQSTRLVAIDGKGTAYNCGLGFSSALGPATMCEAYRPNASKPDWSYTFAEGTDGIVGAAMASGRLYVITPEGNLTALGDSGNTPYIPTAKP